jgi:hypothetical protein
MTSCNNTNTRSRIGQGAKKQSFGVQLQREKKVTEPLATGKRTGQGEKKRSFSVWLHREEVPACGCRGKK